MLTWKRGNDMFFWCILSDELGEEFSVKILAHDMADCIQILREEYPESGIVDVRRY
jgi:hypothetical protein